MKRLKVILMSIWNGILGRAEESHHDEILDLSYEKMLDMVTDVGRQLANAAQGQQRILQLLASANEESQKLEGQAVSFVQAGDDNNARLALSRKAVVDQRVIKIQGDLQAATARLESAKAAKIALDEKVAEFQSTKELMKAEHAIAKSTATMAEQVTGISDEALNIGRTVGRMQESTDQLEARAAGIGELVASGALQDFLSPGQSQLDRDAQAIQRSALVDADLERIKKQLEPAKA